MFSCEYWESSKNTYFEEHLRTSASEVTLGSDCLGLSFWRPLSKPCWLRNITKIPVIFKPELSLNSTPTLCFESRFPMFIINGYDRKSKCLWSMDVWGFYGGTLHKLIFHNSAKFSKFDVKNVTLFQIKVFCRSIKETTRAVAKYFIKVTARPSFTQLRVIKK